MSTIEGYCNDHNLKFSTDPNPSKCKTKCLAFLKKDRPLPCVTLAGNSLPWVKEGIHLGNQFETNYNGMRKDIITKRASFIGKNCELIQEFSYASPQTLLKINSIYNLHFTGSPIWDLFSPETIQLEKTWNISIRKMFNLPLQTHRYLIEEISEMNHLKKILIQRFISFLRQIFKSNKNIPKQLLNCIMRDTRSISGHNLRRIFLLTGKWTISELTRQDIDNINYHKIDEKDKWRVKLIREISEYRNNQLQINGISNDECEEILHFACTS